MHRISKTILTAILILVSAAAHAAILTNTFDSGREGWTGVRLPNEVTFSNILQTVTPTYRQTGGNPGGNISITDIFTIPSLFWFSAPTPFLVNQSGRYGGTIRWDHLYKYAGQSPEPPNLTLPDIALIGADLVLVGDAGPPSNLSNVWHSFSIDLRETNGWHVGNLTNRAPTELEFRAVLADLHTLYVLGEYIGNTDTGHLDNFTMTEGECPLSTIRLSEVEVCWQSQSNRQYRVDYRSAFETTNTWVPFPTNTFLGNGEVMCIYDKIPYGRLQRFYRVVCAP